MQQLIALARQQLFDANLQRDFVEQTITQVKRQTMYFSEPNLDTFIELLTQNRSLFSSEQLAELEQAIEPLEDDLEILSEAISLWSKNHPEIENAQFQLLNNISTISTALLPGKEGNVPRLKHSLSKKNLKNAIVQGSVPKKTEPPTDDTP